MTDASSAPDVAPPGGARLSYAGRAMLVTGAAAGLGRACALLMAARGARVVLADRADAEPTAAAIRAAGGEAHVVAADLADPAAPSACVGACLAHFGRIDGVVAAAGMLRDRSFAKMSLGEDFAPVLRVHLEASARLAHAAWPHMTAQGYGRLLFFSSHAGLFGNFGQANYSAAKMGLVGLTRTLALEGARRGVQVNALAPLAATQMASTTALADHADVLDIADVAAAAGWLCSQDCTATGLTLVAAGAALARVRIVQADPVVTAAPGAATPETAAAAWPEVMASDAGGDHASAWEAIPPLLAALRRSTPEAAKP